MARPDGWYRARIEGLDAFSRTNPRAYLRRVLQLTLLGYAFLGALLVGLLLLLLVMSLLAGVPGCLLGLVITFPIANEVARALWLKKEQPAAATVFIHREDAPELFGRLDSLSERLEAPRQHGVVMDGSFSASLYQVPRLGIFGWFHHHLLIGLQALEAMPVTLIDAMLAHELAHLASAHGSMHRWMVRTSLYWACLYDEICRRRRRGVGVLVLFYGWYQPGRHLLVRHQQAGGGLPRAPAPTRVRALRWPWREGGGSDLARRGQQAARRRAVSPDDLARRPSVPRRSAGGARRGGALRFARSQRGSQPTARRDARLDRRDGRPRLAGRRGTELGARVPEAAGA